MLTNKSQYRALRCLCHHEYATVKKCVFSLARKVDSELALRMSFGSEFQTFGAATQKARLAVSKCVSTAQRDAERRWTAETASSLGVVGVRRMFDVAYSGTEVDRALLYA